MTEKNVELKTSDGPMKAFLAGSDNQGAPAIIVVQEAFGVNHHIREVCRRFAAENYVAIAPEVFHRSGAGIDLPYGDFEKVKPVFSKLTNETLEADLSSSLRFLKDELGKRESQIAVIGFCMGGFAAFLAACRLKIGTAVSFYGGGLIHSRPGFGLTPLLDEADRIRSPVLCFFGAKDQGIPVSDVETIKAKLMAQKRGHEVVLYPNAGHAFFCDERPSYEETAASDAWLRTLDWLKKKLGE